MADPDGFEESEGDLFLCVPDSREPVKNLCQALETVKLILARLVLKAVLAGINSKWGTEVLGFGDSGDAYACYYSQEKMPRKQE